ncbi:MAG: 23S rRNA (pseudouridine(1915)-N(3))-methyltransferase RlmH [Saprospiraceae bacterium]
MEIQLWWIGKTNFKYLEDGILDYTKRLKHFCKFGILEIKSTKSITNPKQVQDIEGTEIKKRIDLKDFIIILDEKGKELSSKEFASQLELIQNTGVNRIIFIVGGAFGFGDEIKSRANLSLSFSKFTLSHQLIRLFFVEQLYRAYTIIHHTPYHNE